MRLTAVYTVFGCRYSCNHNNNNLHSFPNENTMYNVSCSPVDRVNHSGISRVFIDSFRNGIYNIIIIFNRQNVDFVIGRLVIVFFAIVLSI